MAESQFTRSFLDALAVNLKVKLGKKYEIERMCHLTMRGPKSQGFLYDIGIKSRDQKKLVLIEVEIGGKTPIYNLMKTVYWYGLSKDKPRNLMLLHIFSIYQEAKNQDVRQDLTEFTKQKFVKDMFEYRQINFPQLNRLHYVATGEYLTRTGKPSAELEQRLNEALREFVGKDKTSAEVVKRLKKTAEEITLHRKDLKEIKERLIEQVIGDITPHLSKEIVINIRNW